MKFLLRIDDVGRVHGDEWDGTNCHHSDSDLEHFFRWREECGLNEFPATYAVTPKWVNPNAALMLHARLEDNDLIAVHGWDHSRNEPKVDMMEQARQMLSFHARECIAYVPCFNKFTQGTIDAWFRAGGKLFFGSPKESQIFVTRDAPGILPLHSSLYGRANVIRDNAKALIESEHDGIAVLTLHVPWEQYPDRVRELLGVVANHVISVWDLPWLKEWGIER